MKKSQEELIIIAFGDSLTVGFQSPTIINPWYRETPYAQFLGEKISYPHQIIVKGISGELTEEMLRRFDRDVTAYNPDYTIILGGSNDLGWGISPVTVKENLTDMYNSALAKDIKPIAVTVPSIRGFDALIAPRQKLNDMIKKETARLNIPCIDMFTASSEKDTFRLAEQYSNDGLHLSTEGYKLLADILYEDYFSHIVPGKK